MTTHIKVLFRQVYLVYVKDTCPLIILFKFQSLSLERFFYFVKGGVPKWKCTLVFNSDSLSWSCRHVDSLGWRLLMTSCKVLYSVHPSLNLTICSTFSHWKVVYFPRVVKIADAVSILRSNKHNGFPVCELVSFFPSPDIFVFSCFPFVLLPYFLVFHNVGNRSYKKWRNTCYWNHASQVGT